MLKLKGQLVLVISTWSANIPITITVIPSQFLGIGMIQQKLLFMFLILKHYGSAKVACITLTVVDNMIPENNVMLLFLVIPKDTENFIDKIPQQTVLEDSRTSVKAVHALDYITI
jgi:hypothetical protein